MPTVSLPSFAKINWTLDVLGKRSDGYHELRTIYQTVGLADVVTVELTDTPGVDASTDSAVVPDGPDNLAHRAARLFLDLVGRSAINGANIFIRKEIPSGGGLGGGSSNAATTLIALQHLTGEVVPDAELFVLASSIGADVPLFLVGGTVLGVGRGDEVYALRDAPLAHLVIANPGLHIDTATVFQRYASELTPRRGAAAIMLSFLSALRINTSPTVVGNDLEQAVVKDHQRVGDARSALRGAGAVNAWMTGSGASVVGIFESAGAAVSAVEQLEEHGFWARAVETIDRRSYRTALGL